MGKEQNQGRFSTPQGEFIYLDGEKLVKYFPSLKQSYLVVYKDERPIHLPIFDHSKNEMLLINEIKDVISLVYPEYTGLMQETFLEELMDPEKVAFGIALGMRVYRTYEDAFIHFRHVYSNAFRGEAELSKRYPLGDPFISKDFQSLSFIYSAFFSKEKGKMYVYDGFVFQESVMEILENTYGIIEPCSEPQEFNGYFTDAWQLKRKL